ncbi:MAG: phosphoribosyltransferase family protein [Ginsengibacter sp.]
MIKLKELTQGFLHLFYPHVCTGCGNDVIEDENLLCLQCVNALPRTNFAVHANNPVEKIFWGRLPLTAAMSEFYFAKGTIIQHLIHEFKYKGNKDVGIYLGAMMGSSLMGNNRFNKIDALIPLPLYADKERKRGFNQAMILCQGISEVMNIPIIKDTVLRKKFTQTQTKKHRQERWQNVEGSFKVEGTEQLNDKHILLVDDVITTGATLEACGKEILNISNVQLSVATLAYASM